jgi:hypothetical protein
MLPTEVAILLDSSLSQFRGFLRTTDLHGPLQVPSVVNWLDKVLQYFNISGSQLEPR